MKTTIIQLERHDDIASARDKMSWAKSERILVVWPENSSGINRRLDLILIKRHGEALGSQVGVVTRDPKVLFYAPRLGIPVFKSLERAEKEAWRLPRRFRGSPRPAFEHRKISILPIERPGQENPKLSSRARIGFFVLGVAAVLSLAALLVPQVTLRLKPQTELQQIEMDVWTSSSILEPTLAGAIPARWVQVTVEGRDQVATSGSLAVGDHRASGEARFTNLTDATVQIPAGTIALTTGDNPVRFSVTRSGELPASPGTAILLPIQAVNPGASGNLAAGRLTALEGQIGTQVSVTNPNPTTGGTNRAIPAPTAADRITLENRLMRTLEKTALEDLSKINEPGDLIIPASLRVVDTLEKVYLPEPGLPADRLALSVRLEYEALVIENSDLQAPSIAVFNSTLPRGYFPAANTLKIETISTPSIHSQNESESASDEPVFHWTIHATQQIVAHVPHADIIRLALGQTPNAAARRLQQALPLEGPVGIEIRPSWWPLLPILPFRFTVDSAPSG